MNIADGLTHYKQVNREYYDWAGRLEAQAKNILELLALDDDRPRQLALDEAKAFLLDIEKWKAGCLKSRTGNAIKNSERTIWYAFLGAYNAMDDLEAILSIMQLKGFGSYFDDETDQRRAKLATTVLRFLWPDKWGVIDWRTVAILGLLRKYDWDVDKTIAVAKSHSAEEIRGLFDLIDEGMACDINRQYHEISEKFADTLPRVANVDMALFGLSLMVW